MYKRKSTSSAFTIVELLVVIVVIAILAAITVIAYTGVSQKAVASSLQSDLSNAATQLKMFQVENSTFPTVNNCPTPGVTEICLRSSSGNNFSYHADNTSNPKTFSLIASNGSLIYKVTNTTSPIQLASTMQPSVTPGAILELHGAKADGGTSQGINSPKTITWFDTSGNENHGVLTGFAGESPWAGTGTVADPYGLGLPGTASHRVAIPDLSSSEDKTFTWEVWFTTSYSGANNMRLIAEASTNSTTPEMSMMVNGTSGKLQLQMYSDTGQSAFPINSTVVNNGALHHGVLVGNDSQAIFYTDNAASTAQSFATGTLTLNTTTVGARVQAAGGAGYFLGSVFVARIYPFALTPAQVAANYAAGPTW